MAEQWIPVSQLVDGDRIFMGGEQLWATVTEVGTGSAIAIVSVVYDDGTTYTFLRQADFNVKVDREVPQ